MPKSKRPYPAEFRQQMVELVRAGRAPAQLSREFGVTAQSITNWVGQAAIDEGKPLPGKEGLIHISQLAPERVAKVEDVVNIGDQVVVKVVEVDSLVADISASAQEQSTALAEVNTAVNQMDQVTQQNTVMVDQAMTAAANLKNEAVGLGRLVEEFKIADQTDLPGEASESQISNSMGVGASVHPVGRAQARLASAFSPAAAVAASNWEDF